MIKISLVHRITKIIVDAMFYGGIIICIFVPYIINHLNNLFKLGYNSHETVILNIFIISSGITAVYIMWELKKILKTVLNGNPFTKDNVTSLRKISLALMIIALIYGIKIFVLFGIGTTILCGAFMIASLLFLTMKDLFKQACFFKEENDEVI